MDMTRGIVAAVWLSLAGSTLHQFQSEPQGPPALEQLRPSAGLTGVTRPNANLHALLINGDDEGRHTGNITAYKDHLIKVFGVPDTNITVLCGDCTAHDKEATVSSIRDTLADLSRRLDRADTLFIYTTGHGDRKAGQSVLLLEDDESFLDEEFAIKALMVPAGRIHYFGDQCYGGGFAQAMMANRLGQDVIALSAATPDQKCACQHFTPILLKAYAEVYTEREAFAAASRNAKKADEDLPAGLFLAEPGRAWTDVLLRRGIFDEAPPPAGPEYFRPAPELVADRIGGRRPLRLSDYRGSVVLLDFWATWCPPCRRELPDLVRLRESLRKQNFEIIGVTMHEEPLKVQRMMRKHKMRYPVLTLNDDPKGYTVDYLPTAYLIDCAGRIAKTYEGYKEPKELEEDVRTAIRDCRDPATSQPRAPIAKLPS